MYIIHRACLTHIVNIHIQKYTYGSENDISIRSDSKGAKVATGYLYAVIGAVAHWLHYSD